MQLYRKRGVAGLSCMQVCRKRGGAGSSLQKLLLPVLATTIWIATPACSQITFTNPPSDLIVAQGSPARFDCVFTVSTSVSIIWEKDGLTVTPIGRFSYLVNNSLSINPTQAGDNGTYTCVVADQTNQQRVERNASLSFAFILNSFLTTPDSQTVDHGATLILFCIHGGSLPAATITWTHNNDIIVTSSRTLIQQSVFGHTNPPQVSSSLVVTSVVASDAGSYACVANNPLLASPVTSLPATVTVRAPPSPPTITQHPVDVVVIPGQSANFSCAVSGEPPPTITWSRDNVTLTSSSQVSLTSSGGTSLLTITNVQESDSGEYRCQATNSQGSASSQPALLQIASIGMNFELQPQDTVIVIGQAGVLNCISPPSLPPAQISWTKNFAQLPNNQRFQVLQNGSLMISGAELEDQSVYHCTATNVLLGLSRTSQPAQVTTIGVPTIVPSTVTVDSGQSVTLLCSARGNPGPTFSWFKGDIQLLDTDPRLSISGGTLTIRNIVVDDRGFYTCRANFAAGTTESQAYVSVRSPPEFMNTNISITAIVQSQVSLPCDIIPDPTVTFTWQFGGVIVNPSTSGGTYTILSDGSLVIANVQDAHEGTYTCVVTNPLGTATGNVILTVQTPPTIIADSAIVVAIEGNTVTLSCNATGDPVPVQTWSRNGNELMSGGRYQISADGRVLTVQGVTEAQDEGMFTCHASNMAGNDSATITLSVQVLPMVIATPTSQQLSASETASFDCTATGDPAPQVRWLNAASVDVTSLTDSRIEVLSNGTLVISNLRAADQQLYTCEASSAIGRGTATVSLLVTVVPSVSLSAATTATQGNPLTLDCNPIGQPSPSVTWYKDNVQLIPNSRVTIDSEDRLVFSSVISTDAGSYRCEANSSAGTASAMTTLTVLVAPIIQPAILPVIANEGSQAVLDCVAMGNPPPTISWFFNSVPLPSPSISRIQQASNGSLILSPVEKGDEGAYICRASNIAGMESATFQLRVYVAPEILVAEPSITVIEGSIATLTCLATGDPDPVQTWSRNGNELTSGGRYQISADGRVLTVQGVTEAQDEGVFTCHASNMAGNDSADITLSVLIPPRFTQPPVNSTAVEGAQHILTCGATGDPAPLITWSSDDGEVVSSQGTLLFSSVARGDTGLYTCSASSSAGRVEVEIYLDVHYPPSILQPPLSQSVALNSTFVFVCVTDGNPTPQITWLFNDVQIPGAVEPSYTISMVSGTSGGQYTCTATNNIGTVSQSATLTVLFPPSSPTLLFASATSPSTFSVQWTASTNNGGSPITSYVVEYRDTSLTSAPFQSMRVGIDVTSTQLGGLMPYVNYEIRVRGENEVGLSQPSNTISGRTHPAAPSAPGNFRVTSFDSTSLSLSLTWDIPDPLNGQLAAYQLRYTNEGTSVTITRLLFAVTQFRITGLERGVVYRVEVRASTAGLFGESLWGPYAVLRVQDGVELEVPTEAPPTTAPPTTEEEETTTAPVQETTTQAKATTTDEQVGVATTTTMVATTTDEAGTTVAPPTTTAVEQTTTPPPVATTPAVLNPPIVAPSSLVLLPSAGEVFVVWREPSSGLDTFIGYQIMISPAPPLPLTTPILRPLTPGISLYNYTIRGLANFTVYTITVATYNDDGVGPLTAQRTVRTPETAPSAPRDAATLISPSSAVVVTWLPPDPRNGIILQYLVQVLLASTSQIVNSQTVSVGSSIAEQEMGRSATFVGLDLDNFRYRIEIYAFTSAGQGPSSIPVFVGMDSGNATPPTTATSTTTDALPTSTTTVEQPQDTTSSSVQMTSSAATDITSSPSTSTESPTISQTTDILQTVGDTAPAPVRDDEYYIIRIVPPLVIGLFILVIVVAVAVGCCCHSRANREHKKGLYSIHPQGGYTLTNKRVLDGENVVAGDNDVEETSYHIKDALDANFTYNGYSNKQPPARQYGGGVNNMSNVGRGQLESGSRLRRQPYQPNTGQALDQSSGWQQQYPTAGWRDATEEPDSRPDSGELDIMPAQVRVDGGESTHSLGSQSEGSMSSLQRLPYQPGDYTYAELDTIRAKKAQERAKRFGVDEHHSQHHQQQQQQRRPATAVPAPQMTFDPNLGFSNGGIMETRIGAVGRKARDHIPPEASAHMY